MLKRVFMMSLAAGVGLAVLHGGTADAGSWSFVRPPGMWWYYGSVDGCASIAKVPNPLKNPALLQCDVDLSRIETLCVNPNGHNVLPGEAARKIRVSEPIDPEGMSQLPKKEKGKANVCVSIDEANLGLECELRNWTLEAVVTDFRATCKTEQCTGQDDPATPDVNEACNTLVEKDTQVCDCKLPAGFSVENLPDPCPDPLHPTEECVAYECYQVVGGDITNTRCELD